MPKGIGYGKDIKKKKKPKAKPRKMAKASSTNAKKRK